MQWSEVCINSCIKVTLIFSAIKPCMFCFMLHSGSLGSTEQLVDIGCVGRSTTRIYLPSLVQNKLIFTCTCTETVDLL